tara:strand:+ start:171 stop:611 length:441 start_codon:yes stop_codon:yes gene_type:complete
MKKETYKEKTMIYEGLRSDGKSAVFFSFDKKTNKIVGKAMFFKRSKDVTRFPVGMIIDVLTNGKSFRFSSAKWGKIWDSEEVKEMVLNDEINKKSIAIKREENRFKKEHSEIWQEMTIKEAYRSLALLHGKKKINAIALILGHLGL